MTIEGHIALVTGGAKRVGRTIALTLAKAGMDVAITYRTSDAQAQQVVEQIEAMGRRALAISVDLAQPEAADVVYEQFTKSFNSLYALVNNASCFAPSPLDQVDTHTFDHNMAVNARAPLMLAGAFSPLLVRHDAPGRIVNFIDIHVLGEPLKGYAAYNASKAALHEITMSLAIELAPRITVNAIAPGVVAWADNYTPQMKAQYMQRVPLGRPGTSDDAATAVLYLVRDADYCTGQVIKLDGGRSLT